MESEFYNALAVELSTVQAPQEVGDFSEFAVGGRFMDLIKKIFESIDVTALSKEDFLAAVSRAFDTFIAPALASTPFGMIVTPLVKALAMSLASRFYDNHSKPKV